MEVAKVQTCGGGVEEVVSDTGFISLQVLRSKCRTGGNQLGSTAANPSILGSKQ